jgi:spore coat protein CotH
MVSTCISFPNDRTNYLFSNEKKTSKMKIVTWNYNGAFRKKFEYFSDFNADNYII